MQKDNQNISEEEILNNNIEEVSNNNDGKIIISQFQIIHQNVRKDKK